jgi:hypothetical protein
MPRKIILETEQLARELNISPQWVCKLRAKGVLTLARDDSGRELRGCYEFSPNARAFVRYQLEKRKAEGANESDYAAQRNRKVTAEAEIAELTAKELRGELLRGEDVLLVLTSRITGARAQLLAIPSRVSRLLIGETDHRRIHEILYGEIEAALRNVSELSEADLVKQRRKHLKALSANNGHDKRGKRPRRK